MQLQNLSNFKLPRNFRGRPSWYVQLWWISQSLLFNSSPQFLYGWRRFLLRCFGAKIGKGVLLRSSVHTQYPWKLSVGDYSWIGDDVALYNLGNITIGKNVVISQKCYICAGTHNYKDANFPIDNPPVTIHDECWLATDVFVGPGVIIGNGTIVGARSSVFKSIPPQNVCIGTPVVCRSRF